MAFDNHEQLLGSCPYLNYTSISSQDVYRRYDNIIDFVIEAINSDKCLYVYIDRFYIKNLYEHARCHFVHRMFIIGYDTENKVLYVSDNFTNGRYEVITCTFDDFKNAFHRDESRIIRNDILESKYNGDIVNYTIDIIDSNKTALVFADRYSIKSFNAPYHYTHELEFNGYNLGKREFYAIIDYGADCKTLACGFEELKEAYRNDPKIRCINDIGLISRKRHAVIDKLNMDQIIDGLESYAYSKQSHVVEDNYIRYFGIAAMEYLLKCVTEHRELMLRVFQLMYEHKAIMELRVRYLIDNGSLSENDICIEDYIKLKRTFLNLRNIAIKCGINKKNIDHLIDYFHNAVKYDRECCLKLIGTLKRKYAWN